MITNSSLSPTEGGIPEMSKTTRIELNLEQVAWLKDAYDSGMRPDQMADHFGYHVDTIKRLLDRYDISTALSAKHMTSKPKTWNRPCLKCGSTTKRPHNQYICTPCKRGVGSEIDGVHDDFLLY